MNKAILMGRLTKDPEVRYTQNSLTIANFTLAVDRRFNRQGEERQADFIPIVTFGKTAEFCEKYYRKGQQVLVVGRIQTRTWDDNEGRRRYVTEVICEEAYFADSKRTDTGPRPDDFGYMPQMQDNPDSPYGPGAQAFGGSGAQQPGGYGGQPYDAGRQRQAGGEDKQGGRHNANPGFTAGGSNSQDDDGFLPVDNENDLPF